MFHMEHQEWYKTWFDSPYYHLLYQHRDEKEAGDFISRIIDKMRLKDGSIIWDNPCGRGRHTFFLSQYPYVIIGTDISKNNIEYANEKYKRHNTQFFVHDMRREFYVNYFDAVLNIFTSIGYFEYEYEDKKAIKIMANALKNNSYLLIDFFNINYVIKNIVPHETKEIEGVIFETEKEISSTHVIKTIKINDKGKNFLFKEKVRLLTKEFFLNTFIECNLLVENIFGNYYLEEFNEDNSERMIFLCKKW